VDGALNAAVGSWLAGTNALKFAKPVKSGLVAA